MLGSTSGNAFPPTIPVLRCVEGIIPRQFHYSQVLADGLRPILPRSSSSSFSPRSPSSTLAWLFYSCSALFLLLEIFYPGGSQAHHRTLLLYPGLGQAQILHVDSTCKTCGGPNYFHQSRFRFNKELFSSNARVV